MQTYDSISKVKRLATNWNKKNLLYNKLEENLNKKWARNMKVNLQERKTYVF